MKFNAPVSVHVFAYRTDSKRVSWEFRPFQLEKDVDNNIIFCTLFFSVNANELLNVNPGGKLTLTHKTDNDYFIDIEYKSLKKALERLDATCFLNVDTPIVNEENTHERDQRIEKVLKKSFVPCTNFSENNEKEKSFNTEILLCDDLRDRYIKILLGNTSFNISFEEIKLLNGNDLKFYYKDQKSYAIIEYNRFVSELRNAFDILYFNYGHKKELTQKGKRLTVKLRINSQDIVLQGDRISEDSKEFAVYDDNVKIASFPKSIINRVEVN